MSVLVAILKVVVDEGEVVYVFESHCDWHRAFDGAAHRFAG